MQEFQKSKVGLPGYACMRLEKTCADLRKQGYIGTSTKKPRESQNLE